MKALFTLLLLLAAAPASGSDLAATLADQRAAAATPAELSLLLRLQLAARRWQAAEATGERLIALSRETRPQRAYAAVTWLLYARANRYQAEGVERTAALTRAFGELYGSRPDREFSPLYTWFGFPPERLRTELNQAEEACGGRPLEQCPTAAEVVAARQSVLASAYLVPAADRLMRAELERRFIVEDGLTVPMPDGARVAAIMVRPRDPGGRLTALLRFTIYAQDGFAMSDAVDMAAHGYAGIVAYTRGKGRGAGEALPYEHDGQDAATVIEWLAAQPWSDGRVGMFSGSYDASSQWGALKHRPRALMAIATHASNAPGIDTPMQGNVFQSFIYPWPLYTTDAPGLDEVNYGNQARWSALNRNWYVSGRPYRDLPAIDGHPNPIFQTWLNHPAYDSYWQRFIPVGDEFARIDIPVFVATGYFDGGMVGALHYAREHYRHRPNADHRMLIGPYHHFAMNAGVLANYNDYEIDRAALLELREVRLQWFDHVFRGAPLPEVLSGRINFEVMGANRWRHVDSIAAMADRPMRLFLTGRPEGERLRLAEAASAPAERRPELRVDFADRSDVDFQPPTAIPGPIDTRNALVFATAPLPAPIEVAGAFQGHFEIIANKRDLDLSVSFYEQLPDGRHFPLASYLGRASYMEDRSRRRLLRPGRVQTLEFESQTVTARRLAAGSRIVAVVAVPRQPDIQINYGTGRDVSEESIADAGEPLHVRWLPGSYLELGVSR